MPGAVSVASPTPTPTRAVSSREKLPASPPSAVMTLQSATPMPMTLRRLTRSASRPMGSAMTLNRIENEGAEQYTHHLRVGEREIAFNVGEEERQDLAASTKPAQVGTSMRMTTTYQA